MQHSPNNLASTHCPGLRVSSSLVSCGLATNDLRLIPHFKRKYGTVHAKIQLSNHPSNSANFHLRTVLWIQERWQRRHDGSRRCRHPMFAPGHLADTHVGWRCSQFGSTSFILITFGDCHTWGRNGSSKVAYSSNASSRCHRSAGKVSRSPSSATRFVGVTMWGYLYMWSTLVLLVQMPPLLLKLQLGP